MSKLSNDPMSTSHIRGALAFSGGIAKYLRLSAMRVVITGAGGWLGRASLEMLESAFGDEFSRRVAAFGSTRRSLILRSGREVSLGAIQEIVALEPAPTLLLHYAFLTKDRTLDLRAHEYESGNAAIREIVTETIRSISVTHLLVPSSGAVYGLPTRPDRSFCIDEVGNPYGAQKILDERHFQRISSDHGLRVAIPRVFNLSGPYINKYDSYALSSIINAALGGGPVTLRASKRVIRAYTSIRDLIDISIGWLLKDQVPHSTVFDTRSAEPVEIGDLARLIINSVGRPDIHIERPSIVQEHGDVYVGDGRLFDAMADQQGVALSNLESQVTDTIEYLRSGRS